MTHESKPTSGVYIELTQFAGQLNELVAQVIAFQKTYESIRNISPTHIITKRVREKVALGPSCNTTRLRLALTIRKHVNFIHVCNPAFREQIPILPKNASDAEIETETTKLLERILHTSIEKRIGSKSCFYGDNVVIPITCGDILKGRFNDLELIDCLNALRNLCSALGRDRHDNEGTLSRIIFYLGLNSLEKESSVNLNNNLDLYLYYFMESLRTSMNIHLNKIIDLIHRFYKFALHIKQYVMIPTQAHSPVKLTSFKTTRMTTNPSTEILATVEMHPVDELHPKDMQNALNKELLHRVFEDLDDLFTSKLMEQFPAFKDIFTELTISIAAATRDDFDMMELCTGLIQGTIGASLETITSWENIVDTCLRSMDKQNCDDIKVLKMSETLNDFRQALTTFEHNLTSLNSASDKLRTYMPDLKRQLDEEARRATLAEQAEYRGKSAEETGSMALTSHAAAAAKSTVDTSYKSPISFGSFFSSRRSQQQSSASTASPQKGHRRAKSSIPSDRFFEPSTTPFSHTCDSVQHANDNEITEFIVQLTDLIKQIIHFQITEGQVQEIIASEPDYNPVLPLSEFKGSLQIGMKNVLRQIVALTKEFCEIAQHIKPFISDLPSELISGQITALAQQPDHLQTASNSVVLRNNFLELDLLYKVNLTEIFPDCSTDLKSSTIDNKNIGEKIGTFCHEVLEGSIKTSKATIQNWDQQLETLMRENKLSPGDELILSQMIQLLTFFQQVLADSEWRINDLNARNVKLQPKLTILNEKTNSTSKKRANSLTASTSSLTTTTAAAAAAVASPSILSINPSSLLSGLRFGRSSPQQ